MPDLKLVQRKFDRAAPTYAAAAILQETVTQRLLQRLEYIRLQPACVLDLASGTGFALAGLRRLYPKAQHLALDLSFSMLQQQARPRWRRNPARICADMQRLPLASQSVDLVFCSLGLQWLEHPRVLFEELARVLAPDGLLMLTSLGPDTHRELRTAWQSVDDQNHVHQQMDLHALGDGLVASGLREPVVDCQNLSVQYTSVESLLRDLRDTGTTFSDGGGLVGRRRFEAFIQALEQQRDAQGLLSLTYEVHFAQAWGVKLEGFPLSDLLQR